VSDLIDAKMLAMMMMTMMMMMMMMPGYSAGSWLSKPAGSHGEINDVEHAAS